MFPPTLDGASVLFYTPKGDYGTIRYISGEIADYYRYFAICKYANDDNFYLFCCNENYDVVSDWLEDSVDDCMNAASSLYSGTLVWQKIE